MRAKFSRARNQAGASSGTLIWIVVFATIGLIIKHEFFPAPKSLTGSSSTAVVTQHGEPIAKSTIPRPN